MYERTKHKEVGYLSLDIYPMPVASIGTMERATVLLGKTKENALKKINATGKIWTPDLEMTVLCSPPILKKMGVQPQKPETEELKKKFTEFIRLDMRKYRISPEWMEWLMGFPCRWTDTISGIENPMKSAE